MELQRPSFQLQDAKNLIITQKYTVTKTALQTAHDLGFEPDDIADEFMTLKNEEFYKTMTSYSDHRSWQDVYRHSSPAGQLYIKFTIVDNLLILSFKEL